MTKSMCKITYYENILEFKEKCKEQLHVNEINNWQLCRTCMADTSDDDVIMEKMSVIDVMHGSFLSIEDMLFRTVDIKVTATDHLPAKVCKDCVAKISALYYFTLQVHKADKVLKRLTSKLTDYQNAVEIYKTQDNEDDIPEDIIIELDETFCNEDAKYIENVINTLTEEKQTLTEVVEQTTEIEETSALFNEISETEAAIIKNQQNLTEFNIKLDDEEFHLEEEFLEELEDCDVDNEDIFEDTANVKTTKRKKYKLRKTKKKDKPMPAYRHKQPRVSSPLLIDFTCAICQNSFLRQQDLINHVRESHPTSKAYKCRVCGIYFSHIQSLSRHMNSHKNDIVLNKCKFCNKTFARADDLKRHLRVHTGERPYVCTICQKSFQQQFAFKTHKEKHWYEEMNLNPKKFKCAECGQAYLSRNGLYLHKRRKHCTQKSRAPLHDCSLCDKSFHFEAELKRHADKHFLPEFMQCTECDKSFTSANGLYVHKKKNHKSDSNDSKESEKENENEQSVREEEFLDNTLPVSYT